MTIEEIEKEFDEKFSHAFNISVVPDNKTKENIKKFYRDKIVEIIETIP